MKTSVKFIIGSFLAVLFLGISLPVRSQSANDGGKVTSTQPDTAIRNLQVSFLPFLNLNSPSSVSRVNVSINILAGYVQEVHIFQGGTVLNVVQKDAGACQLAGMGNVVLGSSKGGQAAGIFNVAQNADGVQAAGMLNAVLHNAGSCQLSGVANIVGDTAKGLQAAGIVNSAKTIQGVQLAGILNTALTNAGSCQLAGVANFVGDSTRGVQGAGVLNVARSMNGVEVAGVMNAVWADAQKCQLAGVANVVGGSFRGVQAAGVFNYATRVQGLQLSGVANAAMVVTGTQISCFNLADSCSGMPIGFFSFVRTGYHKIEFSTDELLFANIAFRTGVARFHNIFSAGIRPDNFDKPLWKVGYGVGTSFRTTERLLVDIDLLSEHLVKSDKFDFENELYQLYVGVDYRIASKTSVAAGLSCNVQWSDTGSPQYTGTFSKLAPYTFSDKTYNNGHNLKTWLGAKVAIRFL